VTSFVPNRGIPSAAAKLDLRLASLLGVKSIRFGPSLVEMTGRISLIYPMNSLGCLAESGAARGRPRMSHIESSQGS
jgi:hypothetical protein